MSSPITIPQVTIQPTYTSVISDVASSTIPVEDFWVSCYKLGHNSVHGKVRVTKDAGGTAGVKLEARGGVEVEWVNSAALKISCPSLDIPQTLVRAPRQSIPLPSSTDSKTPPQITSFDISPDLTLLATGHSSGSSTLLPLPSASQSTTPSTTTHHFTPHLSTLLSLRFFPSSRVLLSSGSDALTHILPVAPPFKPARTLKAHKRGVTDTAIIERGKCLLTCAKDGTARLWDVPSGSVVRTLGMPSYSPAQKMALAVKPPELDLSYLTPSADAQIQPNGTNQYNGPEDAQGKLVAIALQSGSFTLFDLSSPLRPIHTSEKGEGGALHAIALSASGFGTLATGSLNGFVSLYDLRNLGTPSAVVRRNTGSIEDLAFLPPSSSSDDLAIASEDGLPFRLRMDANGPSVVEEYGGWDCDAVRCVRVRGGGVWMGGDDGVVRRY